MHVFIFNSNDYRDLYRQSSHDRWGSKYNNYWIIRVTSIFCGSEDLCTEDNAYGHENKFKKTNKTLK